MPTATRTRRGARADDSNVENEEATYKALKKSKSSKSAKTVPVEEPQADPKEDELDQAEFEESLGFVMEELDVEVENRVQVLRKLAREIERKLMNKYTTQMMKFPKEILNMKKSDFERSGGNIEKAMVALRTSSTASAVSETPLRTRSGAMVSATPSMSTRSKKTVSRTVSACATGVKKTRRSEKEESVKMAPSTVTRSKKRKSNEMSQQEPTSVSKRRTRASLSKEQESEEEEEQLATYALPVDVPSTPAATRAGAKGLMTPKTPAFDPRLPYTPMTNGKRVRRPKRGESIMSFNGSPLGEAASTARATFGIGASNNDDEFVVELGDGQEFDLTKGVNKKTVKKLDNDARDAFAAKLAKMQEQIAAAMTALN